MIKLKPDDVKIIRELIKNPRISDNKISKNTKIPVMSVNRKRKKLEASGFLRYYTSFDTGEHGTKFFNTKQLYIVRLKEGITKEQYLQTLEYDKNLREFNAQYISWSYLGEKEGQLAMCFILDAKTESDLVDEFNGKIIPDIKEKLGKDSVEDVTTCRLHTPIRFLHNYLPFINMEKGFMKKDWLDEWIFIDEAKSDIK